jgi:hypothetical protein
VARIKWSFKHIKMSVVSVRDAFTAAAEDGKIDESEANEI